MRVLLLGESGRRVIDDVWAGDPCSWRITEGFDFAVARPRLTVQQRRCYQWSDDGKPHWPDLRDRVFALCVRMRDAPGSDVGARKPTGAIVCCEPERRDSSGSFRKRCAGDQRSGC